MSSSKKIIFATYNLYQGGSKVIKNAFEKIDHPRITIYSPGYPAKKFNFIYRIFLDQIVIPIYVCLKGGSVVLFGNVPSVLYFGKQAVFFHNVNYLSDRWKFIKIRNFLEWVYFSSVVSVKKRVKFLVQTEEVRKILIRKYPKLVVNVIGSPIEINVQEKKGMVNEYGRYLYYPSSDEDYKNINLLNNVAEFLLNNFGIKIICTVTGYSNLICIGSVTYEKNLNMIEHSCAVVFPSLHESLGYPLIESSLLNKSLIAIDKPYVHSVVEGIYSFQNNEESLINAIRDALYDGFKKIPEKRIETDPEIIMESILKILEE